jgi:hypothetical protein
MYLKNICDNQLHAPTNICHANDGSGRIFICDQPGKIYVFRQGMLLPTPLLDLTSTGLNKIVTSGTGYSERGLLGMCFHPDFNNATSPGYRCFYVNYTAPATTSTPNAVLAGATTNCVTIIAEYKVSATNPNVADSTERVVLSYAQPQSNHNGGQLEFGPDGLLYIGSGDGGGANDNPVGHTQGSGTASAGRSTGTLGNGQDRRNLWGKILRINPLDPDGAGPLTYSIPASNPFVGANQDFTDNTLDGPMREEIYAYGLRNPWRFSFDSSFGGTNSLICADVGQNNLEEVDLIVSGGNYGWRMKEGSFLFDTISAYSTTPVTVDPIAQYTHPTVNLPGLTVSAITGTSVTGGYVYRGNAIPGLVGKYLFADYSSTGVGGAGGAIFLGLEETAPSSFTLSQVNFANSLPSGARIYAFGQDQSGEIYVCVKTTSGVLALDGGFPAGIIYQVVPPDIQTVEVAASKDNTIFEQTTSPWRSNGQGPHIFAGRTGASAGEASRRALVRFDLSSLPTGVTWSSAAVSLTLTLQVGEGFPMTLHKLNSDWGEGASNAGEPGGSGANAQTNDATWRHRFFSTQNWTTDGGDFVNTASATINVGNFLSQPLQTWTSAQLLTDVQSWITNPSTNYGWLLKGDETQSSTAQRFASRNNSNTALRPKLVLTSQSAPQPTRFESWFSTHFPSSPPGTFLDLEADADNDGTANLIEYAYNFSPLARNLPSDGLTTSVTQSGGNSTLTVTFRRDPRATDLTYNLEVSDDLTNWTTVVSSTAGATATGSAFVSDNLITAESPMRLVTAAQTTPGLQTKKFVRLRVTRN